MARTDLEGFGQVTRNLNYSDGGSLNEAYYDPETGEFKFPSYSGENVEGENNTTMGEEGVAS